MTKKPGGVARPPRKGPPPPVIDDAPGLAWRPRAGGRWVAVWLARQDIAAKGFRPSTQRLWSGTEPTSDEAEHIAKECRRLQDNMKTFRPGAKKPPVKFGGTINDLLDAYQKDADSPYHDQRPVTRADYDWRIAKIKKSIGGYALADLNGRDFKRYYSQWRKPRITKDKDGKEVVGPERVRRAHGLITMLRIVLGYGKSLKIEHCRDLKDIISDLRFESAAPRTERLDAVMADDVRKAAHAAGKPSIALAQAIQFELTLRQKDVVGEWVKIHEDGVSDVTDRGRKWIRGLRWEEIDQNGILTHKTSKRGQVLSFNLALYPMIVEELASIPDDKRNGPIIVCESTGLPYRTRHFAGEWREVADLAGVPKGVWNMDSRAGGVTEAMEADPSQENLEAVRHHTGHQNIATTQRYSRATAEGNSKVAILRVKHRTDAERK